MKMLNRVLDLFNLGAPVCADCGVDLRTVEAMTPPERLDRGRRGYQRCRSCWLSMVRGWETG